MDVVVKSTKEIESIVSLDDTVFAREYNEPLVHQVITAYLANARYGTRAQKERSDVNKSTKRPWKQKGTGRARAGMASSPLWRGGGKIFASSPNENFSQKVNKKMHRSAVCVILSKLVSEARLSIVDNFDLESSKTKDFKNLISGFGFDINATTLIIVPSLSENLYLSSRNLYNVLILEANQLDPYSLVRFDRVIFTKDAISLVTEQLI